MNNGRDLDEVKNFFSSYFHEDWSEETDSAAGVLAIYLRQDSSRDALLNLAQGIESFFARHATDAEIEHSLFSDLGCYYLPSADHESAREWLAGILKTLRTEAERRRSASPET